MDAALAKKFVQELSSAGVLDPSATRTLLLQYARRSGRLQPEDFLTDQMTRGEATTAAVQSPAAESRRRGYVNIGEEEGMPLHMPLSNVAMVFYPTDIGDWESRQIQKELRPGEQPEIEFIFRGEGKPKVEALGVIEVNERGTVVRVVRASSKLAGGRAALVDLMRKARWDVSDDL